MKIRQFTAALGAACLIGVGLIASAGPASAADGDTPLNLTFDGLTPTSLLSAVSATTDLTKADPGRVSQYGLNTMWDESRYIIGANPNDFHPLWVNWPDATDNMLLVNGSETSSQTVLEVSAPGQTCDTGEGITYTFSANMVNVLPTVLADSGAKISVYVNGTQIGSEQVLTNDPSNVIGITGFAPAADPMVVTIVNNSTVKIGNDFAIDDLKLTQNGECTPPCQTTVHGVWWNYTGKYTGTGTPSLTDPKWHALPATPGGEHDVAVRGFDQPYQPGKDKGKGDWFKWTDDGIKCPATA